MNKKSPNLNKLNQSFVYSQFKDKQLLLNNIVNTAEKGTGYSLIELKEMYSEKDLFYIALKYVTSTKKAICKAFDITLENACRYKRLLEQQQKLVQSSYKVYCPFTGCLANLLSTNPNEFDKLCKISTNQLNLFKW